MSHSIEIMVFVPERKINLYSIQNLYVERPCYEKSATFIIKALKNGACEVTALYPYQRVQLLLFSGMLRRREWNSQEQTKIMWKKGNSRSWICAQRNVLCLKFHQNLGDEIEQYI